MAQKLIWGRDLYNGFKIPQNTLLGKVDDILPFQMLKLEEKTIDWIKAVADYYEVAGWHNVERKAGKIQRNYWMRNGLLNPSDYLTVPDENAYYQAVGWLLPPENQSPLQQFYPIAPNFVDILRGEFTKMDNTWAVEAIDPDSKTQVFAFKEGQFRQVLEQQAAMEKQMAMERIGAVEKSSPEQYQQQMQQLQQKMQVAEMEARDYRTTGVMWAEKVLKIHESRYNLAEIEPDAFESGLITDSEFWHLDLLDDDFKVELLNPKWCDYHKGPNKKYVSSGDYFLWFDFGSAGDVVNHFGRRMKEEDILKLKDIYVKTANIIVPDYLKNHQGSYYDLSKNWLQATDLDPKMNDALLGKELAYNFMRSPNFDHNQEVDILNPIWGRRVTGHPQMFRIMRLYWRSMRRIGWLTRIDKDGTIYQPDWIDENYKVTIEPEYDTSVIKDETKDNLLYGEHVDWTWGPEWRQVIKISPNQKHTFWLNSQNSFESIYIDGGPVKYQFKGRKNPFDCLPPVEGCIYSYINMSGHSFIDRVKPFQILYNICMNKVPKKFLKDYGNKVAVHKALMPTNNLTNNSRTIDPAEAMEDKLMESDIFDFSFDPELARGFGQPPLPQVLQLSTVQEAQYYMQVAQAIKWEAGELVGITRQKAAGARASDTAYSVQQGIEYSETQLQKYFEQHGNLMEKVRQRMLDAAQYYSTFQQSARDTYMNEQGENVWLQVEGMDNDLTHYNINLVSRASTMNALKTIQGYLEKTNTLDIQPSKMVSALVEKSVPRLQELIRIGELEHAQKEQQARDHEMQMEQERRQTLMMQVQQQEQFTASEGDKNRQNKIDVALITSSGGNESTLTPPQDNSQQAIDNQMQQQKMDSDTRLKQQAQDDKRQHDMEKLAVEREKSEKDLEKEKLRLKAAKAKGNSSKK